MARGDGVILSGLSYDVNKILEQNGLLQYFERALGLGHKLTVMVNVRLSLILCAIREPWRTETALATPHKLNKLDLTILRHRLGKNTVVSSFAFRQPLCKLAANAASTTRHEIISVLDIQTLSEIKTCYSSLFPALSPLLETDLTTLNKIYVNYTDNIDDKFILGSQAYGVTVSKIGYNYPRDAVAYVNREFSAKTYMRIRDVLDSYDIDEYSSILLVNGFHYKGTWETPFAQTSTQYKQFRSKNQTLHVQMMKAITQCSFLNDASGKYKAISLRLTQGGMYMTFLLPYQSSSIVHLLDTMSRSPEFFNDIDKRMRWKFVNVVMPKFKIKTCLDWTPYLKWVGLNLTTNINNTGLNGILKDNKKEPAANMYLSKAKQKIFVETEESPMRKEPAPFQEIPQVRPELERDLPDSPQIPLEDFIVDGPFFFSVAVNVGPRNRKRGKRNFQLFSGVYYGPE